MSPAAASVPVVLAGTLELPLGEHLSAEPAEIVELPASEALQLSARAGDRSVAETAADDPDGELAVV
jgi:hypothetical protein